MLGLTIILMISSLLLGVCFLVCLFGLCRTVNLKIAKPRNMLFFMRRASNEKNITENVQLKNSLKRSKAEENLSQLVLR